MGKAKGTTLLGAVKALRTMKDEARAVLPEPLHHYLSAKLQTASWYPEEDLLVLIRTLLEITPGDRDAKLRAMGVATAQALGEGVYSHLMQKTASSTTTFALWSSMHDMGKLTSWKDDETGRVVFELQDYADASPEMCAITGSFIEEALRMSGRSIKVRKDACTLDGAKCCRWKGVSDPTRPR